MDAETRFETGDKGEKIVNGPNNSVHVHVYMITIPERQGVNREKKLFDVSNLPPNGSCQLFGPPASLRAGILRTHIAGMENSAGELSGIGRKIARIGRLSGDASGVINDLFVWVLVNVTPLISRA